MCVCLFCWQVVRLQLPSGTSFFKCGHVHVCKLQHAVCCSNAAFIWLFPWQVVRLQLPSGTSCLKCCIDATRRGNVARFINHR
jgi:hypothetical protein